MCEVVFWFVSIYNQSRGKIYTNAFRHQIKFLIKLHLLWFHDTITILSTVAPQGLLQPQSSRVSGSFLSSGYCVSCACSPHVNVLSISSLPGIDSRFIIVFMFYYVFYAVLNYLGSQMVQQISISHIFWWSCVWILMMTQPSVHESKQIGHGGILSITNTTQDNAFLSVLLHHNVKRCYWLASCVLEKAPSLVGIYWRPKQWVGIGLKSKLGSKSETNS